MYTSRNCRKSKRKNKKAIRHFIGKKKNDFDKYNIKVTDKLVKPKILKRQQDLHHSFLKLTDMAFDLS